MQHAASDAVFAESARPVLTQQNGCCPAGDQEKNVSVAVGISYTEYYLNYARFGMTAFSATSGTLRQVLLAGDKPEVFVMPDSSSSPSRLHALCDGTAAGGRLCIAEAHLPVAVSVSMSCTSKSLMTDSSVEVHGSGGVSCRCRSGSIAHHQHCRPPHKHVTSCTHHTFLLITYLFAMCF
jgi:hypothetical protein